MRTAKVLAASVTGPRGRSVKGDTLTGPENDLSALVLSGAAEWADVPQAPTEPAPKTTRKRASTTDPEA